MESFLYDVSNLEEGSSASGMKCVILMKLSIVTQMIVCPFEGAICTIKSIARYVQQCLWTGKARNKPGSLDLENWEIRGIGLTEFNIREGDLLRSSKVVRDNGECPELLAS